jgi:hypothetical protein
MHQKMESIVVKDMDIVSIEAYTREISSMGEAFMIDKLVVGIVPTSTSEMEPVLVDNLVIDTLVLRCAQNVIVGANARVNKVVVGAFGSSLRVRGYVEVILGGIANSIIIEDGSVGLIKVDGIVSRFSVDSSEFTTVAGCEFSSGCEIYSPLNVLFTDCFVESRVCGGANREFENSEIHVSSTFAEIKILYQGVSICISKVFKKVGINKELEINTFRRGCEDTFQYLRSSNIGNARDVGRQALKVRSNGLVLAESFAGSNYVAEVVIPHVAYQIKIRGTVCYLYYTDTDRLQMQIYGNLGTYAFSVKNLTEHTTHINTQDMLVGTVRA